MAEIKTMKLYHQVDRVFNEMEALGYCDGDSLPIDELSQYDQYHYLGTQAVDESVTALGIGANSRVLEIGSGIGGPARHLAHTTGCRVTAMELQPDLDATAAALTQRCGLGAWVDHVCADALDPVAEPQAYDAVVSWLAFLHIPDRPTLYARCIESLAPGGAMFVEDYFARGTLTSDERSTLAADVACEHVPTLEEYRVELETAGFQAVQLDDVSEPWTDFVGDRLAAFRADRERNVALHGEALVAGLDHFYSSVESLFRAGNLGGVRLVAQNPR